MIDIETIDIETRVAESLHAGVDRTPVRDGLYERALSRAGVIRGRRRALALCGGGLAVVVAVAVILPQFAPGPPHHVVPAAPAPSLPAPAKPTNLPGMPAVLPAGTSPASVGTDPAVLHFDADLAKLGATIAQWHSGASFEGVAALTKSGAVTAEIFIGRSPAAVEDAKSAVLWFIGKDRKRAALADEGPISPVTVDGRPGTLQHHVPEELTGAERISRSSWILRWQPVDGLHALVQVFGKDRDSTLAAATALRLDRSQRCAVPAHLTKLPTGTKVTGCRTAIRTRPSGQNGVLVHSLITLSGPAGVSSVWIEDPTVQGQSRDVDAFTETRKVAGYPAQWRAKDPRGLWILNYGPVEVFVETPSEGGAVLLSQGIKLVPDFSKAAGWPAAGS